MESHPGTLLESVWSGLGYMVIFYGNTFKTALVFVPIITLAFIAIAITEVIRWAERRLVPWMDRS